MKVSYIGWMVSCSALGLALSACHTEPSPADPVEISSSTDGTLAPKDATWIPEGWCLWAAEQVSDAWCGPLLGITPREREQARDLLNECRYAHERFGVDINLCIRLARESMNFGDSFPDGSDPSLPDHNRNCLRHLYWVISLVRHFGPVVAQEMANFHELPDQGAQPPSCTWCDTQRDQYNNALAILLATQHTGAHPRNLALWAESNGWCADCSVTQDRPGSENDECALVTGQCPPDGTVAGRAKEVLACQSTAPDPLRP